MDQTISYLKSLGLNALISKLDLSDAFCHILVDPRDWEILGSTWPLVMSDCSTRTGYFFDMLLLFALRSSPALFLKFVNGLRSLIDLLEAWSTKQLCTKRQLQSLIGNLKFIHTMCLPGRTFLRRMLDVLCRAHHTTHHPRLNQVFHKDLLWW